MDNELIIAGNKKRKVFLQDGFYSSLFKSANFHKHNYAEIHILANGSVDFIVDGTTYHLKSGSLILIPKGAFHSYTNTDIETKHIAFQIDCDLTDTSIQYIDIHIILQFLQEIEECKLSDNYSKIASYIALFYNYLAEDEKISVIPASDYGFLIHEFFSKRYNEDLHLCDLANYLHLSERQSERLVIEHTGKSFREELIEIRMTIAKELLKSTNMTLKEIAQYVGYKSYTGFWKAIKKYNIEIIH